MMEAISSFFGGFVKGAEHLGSLSAPAIYAFFNLLMIAYIVWDLKTKKESAQIAWEARIKDAETDGMMARAIEQLARELRDLSETAKNNGVLIKELKHRIKCLGGQDD